MCAHILTIYGRALADGPLPAVADCVQTRIASNYRLAAVRTDVRTVSQLPIRDTEGHDDPIAEDFNICRNDYTR